MIPSKLLLVVGVGLWLPLVAAQSGELDQPKPLNASVDFLLDLVEPPLVFDDDKNDLVEALVSPIHALVNAFVRPFSTIVSPTINPVVSPNQNQVVNNTNVINNVVNVLPPSQAPSVSTGWPTGKLVENYNAKFRRSVWATQFNEFDQDPSDDPEGTTTLAPAPYGPDLPTGFSFSCLNAINGLRSYHKYNALFHDPELAKSAQKRAQYLLDEKRRESTRMKDNYWDASKQSDQNTDYSKLRRPCVDIINNNWCRQTNFNPNLQVLESETDAACRLVTRSYSHRAGCAQVGSPQHGYFTVCQYSPMAPFLLMSPTSDLNTTTTSVVNSISRQLEAGEEEQDGFDLQGSEDQLLLTPSTFNADCLGAINRLRKARNLTDIKPDRKLIEVATARVKLLADIRQRAPEQATLGKFWEAHKQSHQNLDYSWKRQHCAAIVAHNWCHPSSFNSSRLYLESRTEAPECPLATRSFSHRVGCAQWGGPSVGYFTVCQFSAPPSTREQQVERRERDVAAAPSSEVDWITMDDRIFEDPAGEKDKNKTVTAAPPTTPKPYTLEDLWQRATDEQRRELLRKAAQWHMKENSLSRLDRLKLKHLINKNVDIIM